MMTGRTLTFRQCKKLIPPVRDYGPRMSVRLKRQAQLFLAGYGKKCPTICLLVGPDKLWKETIISDTSACLQY